MREIAKRDAARRSAGALPVLSAGDLSGLTLRIDALARTLEAERPS
ncbi:MAG: hypothetical protein ACK4JY_07685 [Brevundimonas sp.]